MKQNASNYHHSINDLLIGETDTYSSDSDTNDENEKISSYERNLILERERVKKRIRGFDWRRSQAWHTLINKFGPKLNHDELTSIADLIAGQTNIKLDRDARRRKIVLVKWFEEHWTIIQPLINIVVLSDERT